MQPFSCGRHQSAPRSVAHAGHASSVRGKYLLGLGIPPLLALLVYFRLPELGGRMTIRVRWKARNARSRKVGASSFALLVL